MSRRRAANRPGRVVVSGKMVRVTGNGLAWLGRRVADGHLRDGLRFGDCVRCGVQALGHESGLCKVCAAEARGDF